MVWFAAAKGGGGVDMSDLSELGQLNDWDNIKAPNTKVTVDSFKATLRSDKDIEYYFWGEDLTLKGGVPRGGTVTQIEVYDQDQPPLAVNYLYSLRWSIPFQRSSIQNEFSGNFESSLFSGNDKIIGSRSDDVLIGYLGRDRINGGGGDDIITGGKKGGGNDGSDKLRGRDGDDTINGCKGGDLIFGDDGSDALYGSGGKDVIYGGTGDDLIDGGKGKNKLTGGDDNDTFVFAHLGAVSKVTDYQIGETIELARKAFSGIGPKGMLQAEYFHVGDHASADHAQILYDDQSGWLLFARKGAATDNPVKIVWIGAALADFDHGDIMVI